MAFQGFLKEDIATTFRFGPFVDKTTGYDYEVGMAAAMNHADTGIRISKNGGALAARTTATEPVYDAFGYYLVNLDATDVGTPGRLKVIFGDAAVCLPCEADFQIVAVNVFDSLYSTAAADLLDVNCGQWLGTAILAPGVAGTPDVNAKQIGGTAQTAGDVVAVVADIHGTDLPAVKVDTAAILVDTAVIGALGAGLTALADKSTLDLMHTDIDAILADTGTDGVILKAAGLNADATAAIADKILGRSIIGGADGGRMVKDALKALRNKRAIAGGTLTVYEADDATPAWTAVVGTTAGNPVSSVDPA